MINNQTHYEVKKKHLNELQILEILNVATIKMAKI